MQRIKADALGQCYNSLGDVVWQILCDIYLYNLEKTEYSISELAWSIGLSEPIMLRHVLVLQTELLLHTEENTGVPLTQNLTLTDVACAKMETILADCREAFTESFVYSHPKLVESDG